MRSLAGPSYESTFDEHPTFYSLRLKKQTKLLKGDATSNGISFISKPFNYRKMQFVDYYITIIEIVISKPQEKSTFGL